MPYKTSIKIICPVCKKEFETKNRNKKFCTKQCGGKSTVPFHSAWSEERKKKASIALKQKYENDPDFRQKVSDGLKNYYSNNPDKIRRGKAQSICVGKATKGKYKSNSAKNILELSSRTVRKILSRLKIGCSICGWNEAVCDIHHIDGRKIENCNDHKNLSYVCPNCHRLIHLGKIKKEQLITLEALIGNRWIDLYFG